MKRISVLVLAAAAAACAAPNRKSAPPAAAPAAAQAAPAAKPAAVAAAAPAPAAAPAARPALPAVKLEKLSGTLASVDASAGTVSITAHGATKALRVAEGAKLTKGGDMAAIALKDVAAGAHVSVSYAGDVLAALHVKVLAAAPPAEKVAKAEKPAKGK